MIVANFMIVFPLVLITQEIKYLVKIGNKQWIDGIKFLVVNAFLD